MAGGVAWTVPEDEFILQQRRSGKTIPKAYAAFQERFGSAARSGSSFHKRAVDLMAAGRVLAKPAPGDDQMRRIAARMLEASEATVVPEWSDEGTYHDPAVTWERAKIRNDAAIQHHEKRHKATVQVVSGKPIGVSFISDQHISEGSPTDIKRMEHDARLIASTPGLYGVLGGDGVDNHIKHRTAMIASGSKPGDEWRMYDHYLQMFGSKLLGMCSGNHDDWTKDFTDVDMVGLLAKKNRIFYAPDFVVLTIRIGTMVEGDFKAGQDYVAKIRHQYRYGSSFNQTHSVKRMWEMDDDDFDIGVVCHQHEAAMEPFTKHGVERVAFRPGSYQIQSGYSRRFGFSRSIPKCPTAVVLPDRREIVPFKDVRQAASYLTWLRDGWPETGAVFGEVEAA